MNYKKIYDSIIDRSKKRISNNLLYERHHIVPCFMFKDGPRAGRYGTLEGNYDDPSNISFLTPKEHMLCHILLIKFVENRYKNSAAYSLALLSRLNNAKIKNLKLNPVITVNSINKISNQNKRIRKTISKHTKGTVVVKDAISGEMIGKVSVNDPRYISGEFVFYQKGVPNSEKLKKKISEAVKNEGNPNYSGILDEEYLSSYLECCKELEFNCGVNIWNRWAKKNDKPSLRMATAFRFQGNGFSYLAEEAQNTLGFVYDPYFTRQTKNKELIDRNRHKWQ